ncbi:nitrate transport ATP-binding protein [Xanthomonas oryzae pv. oryzae KACC 10331]|uniref:Nitrate transport ATP-binding protein n=1 Tax=Xanthomonas oryzae pv. oryzae (strain KACC10331 / KXO85) TaxID=291331 RepID=Q5GY69_XANOR|nr:nitrate transport ATP-binding protein [Xanthomonas oryzae pv. oryzae KACC 10331]
MDLQLPGIVGVRDRLLAGEVEAAHALASLVYAIDLGIAGPQCPMALLMTLNHNGQAITLAPALAHALAAGRTLPQALTVLGRCSRRPFPPGRMRYGCITGLLRAGLIRCAMWMCSAFLFHRPD